MSGAKKPAAEAAPKRRGRPPKAPLEVSPAVLASDAPVSTREFGAIIGRSGERVRQLVKAGVIPTTPDGKVLIQAGLQAFRLYTQGKHDPHGARIEAALDQCYADPPQPKRSRPEPTRAAQAEASLEDAVVADHIKFSKAKTQEKIYSAKLKQLEVQRLTGEMYLRTDIEADAEAVAAEVRGRLLAVPPRIAALCENKTAREIQAIIEDAINEALEGLQKGVFIHE